MKIAEKYMQRCLQLATQGMGHVSPNPMVGCVIVYENKIIGEGYHRRFGGAHAEVEAINQVNNKKLLKNSTLYVNLEPCSHFGKTPPCADLILENNIPHVVIACKDPHEKVAGKGIEKLVRAGVKVDIGILQNEATEINKRFFTYHQKKRPYVILKWAQTTDGYIDKIRSSNEEKPTKISDLENTKWVHLWRTQEDAILVGTQTALLDNPALTSRLIKGKNPTKILIDKELKTPTSFAIFDRQSPLIVFNSLIEKTDGHIRYIKLNFTLPLFKQILDVLYTLQIQSLIVEGGAFTLNQIINEKLFDEVRVFVSKNMLGNGVKAPEFPKEKPIIQTINNDTLYTFYNI
jgi:diaminohydroxyphosphoribosylaminopyrimidine deaminase / 5-amino-6-(5-phosphoribosylamino)uracil reductase